MPVMTDAYLTWSLAKSKEEFKSFFERWRTEDVERNSARCHAWYVNDTIPVVFVLPSICLVSNYASLVFSYVYVYLFVFSFLALVFSFTMYL
jgi:hypothetical protein